MHLTGLLTRRSRGTAPFFLRGSLRLLSSACECDPSFCRAVPEREHLYRGRARETGTRTLLGLNMPL